MQPSSPVKPGSTVTCNTAAATSTRPENSKTHSDTPRVASPGQRSRAHFDSPLRMQDFYNTDPIFRQLIAALKPTGASARTDALLRGFALRLGEIRIAVLDAEKSFTRTSCKECALHLHAAKANQVMLLAQIDGAAEDVLPAAKRAELHSGCVYLGNALSKMLVQGKVLATTGSASQFSPPHSQQKRTQSHPDSPVFITTSPKRRRPDTPPPQVPESVSSPAYKARGTNDSAPSCHAADSAFAMAPSTSTPSATSATSIASTIPLLGDQPAQSAVASTSSPSPRKPHRLTAQPRPRPASQLFIAPPDCRTEATPTSVDAVRSLHSLPVESSGKPLGAPSPDIPQ